MIAIRLGWLILQGILLGYLLYFGNTTALILMALLVLIPLGCIFINLYVGKQLKVKLTAEVNLKKGTEGTCTVTIDNPTIFPVLRAGCKVQGLNQLNREEQREVVLTWLPPKRQQTFSLNTGSDYCGRLRIAVQELKLYDCFGLIGIPCKCEAVAHVTVQPDTFDMNVTLIPGLHSIEDSDLYSQNRPGQDLSETYQIREYVPGDSPKQIHWKLTGKFDKLIVRDPALPIIRNVLIFWERTGESGDKELIDAQAETIITLCRSLLEQSIQFTIGWNDIDRNLCVFHSIQDMDELVGVIPRVLRATGQKDGISGVELLLQTGRDALCAHMVYIGEEPADEVMEMKQYGHVSMLLCGKSAMEEAVIFDAEHYKEQLVQIEV